MTNHLTIMRKNTFRQSIKWIIAAAIIPFLVLLFLYVLLIGSGVDVYSFSEVCQMPMFWYLMIGLMVLTGGVVANFARNTQGDYPKIDRKIVNRKGN